jgi:hypothetical protein
LGCNEVFGLEPGALGETGGVAGAMTAGSNGLGGGAAGPSGGGTGGTNGGTMVAGTGATPGGLAGASGAGAQQGGTDAGGSGADGGEGGALPGACSTTTDCKEQGFDWPHICRSGKCIDITTDHCNILIGAGAIQPEPEPFIIGVYLNFDVPHPSSVGSSKVYWSVRLAVEEFIDQGGIPIGGEKRLPLMLLCIPPNQTSEDPAALMRGMIDHLVDTVGVPGVLMLTQGAEVDFLARYALHDRSKDVFFVHHGGTIPELENLDDDGRVWHMLGSDLDLAPIYVPLVERVEEHVNPGRTRATRLLLLQSSFSNFFGGRLPAALSTTLRINGALASAQLDTNYFQVTPAGNLEDVAASIAELEPDIIVDLDRTWFYPLIDAAARSRGPKLPFYVVPPSQAFNSYLLGAMYDDPSLRTRVAGVNLASAEETAMYDGYVTRINQIAPFNMVGYENLYDSVYFLLYAAAAAGTSRELNGRALRDGMRRLLDGEEHEIGPNQIDTILGILTEDTESSIRFLATMGAPDFNRNTGARIVGGSVFCVRDDLTFAYDVLRRNSLTGTLSGTFPCYDF